MDNRYLCKAKRVDTGEWVEGFYAIIGKRHVIIKKEPEDYYSVDDNLKKGHGNEVVEVDPSTLCRCTGLTDKNSKKIWESDIVSCGGNLAVTWKENLASFCLSKKGWMYQHFFGEAVNAEDVEVIGNVFDNQELLKGGSEW